MEKTNESIQQVKGSARNEANIIQIPSYNIFNRYNPNFEALCRKGFKSDRSYEDQKTYYSVLKPFTRYEGTNDMMRIEKTFRNKFKYSRILITREINESRTHYNVLFTTKVCPLCTHNRTIAKDFYHHIQYCPQVKDINQVITYMSKEATTRQMNPGEDKFIYIKE